MFLKQNHLGYRLFAVLVLCSVGLFWWRDHAALGGVRAFATDVTGSLYQIAGTPARLWDGLGEFWVSRTALQEQVRRLEQENLVIKGQTQRLAAIMAENARYRALLNSAALVANEVMVAEIIGVTPDPSRHILMLDKGRSDGVTAGLPILGADGLMGQVIAVGENHSQALLITDLTHAVPIQINRNGVRGIAEGAGDLNTLIVRHIAATTDIKVGDLLVTSGLARRFPQGYPVAKVISVELAPGEAFATVHAAPLAALDKGKHVLVAGSDKPSLVVDTAQ